MPILLPFYSRMSYFILLCIKLTKHLTHSRCHTDTAMCELVTALNPAAHGRSGWDCPDGQRPAVPVCQHSESAWGGVNCNKGVVVGIFLIGLGLKGTLPSSLGSLTRLTMLDIHFNSITGSIPATLGLLSEVIDIRLDGNALTGPVPFSVCSLGNLKSLSLNGNSLSCLPECLRYVAATSYASVHDVICSAGYVLSCPVLYLHAMSCHTRPHNSRTHTPRPYCYYYVFFSITNNYNHNIISYPILSLPIPKVPTLQPTSAAPSSAVSVEGPMGSLSRIYTSSDSSLIEGLYKAPELKLRAPQGMTFTYGLEGLFGSAAYLDGTGQYLVAPAIGLPAGPKTVSFWVKLDTVFGGSGSGLGGGGETTSQTGTGGTASALVPGVYLLAIGGAGPCTSRLTILVSLTEDSNKNALDVQNGCESVVGVSKDLFNVFSMVGKWTHIAITSTTDLGTALFVNGVSVAVDLNSLTDINVTSGSVLVVGAGMTHQGEVPYIDSNTAGYMHGAIDNIYVYSAALTSEDVFLVYKAQMERFHWDRYIPKISSPLVKNILSWMGAVLGIGVGVMVVSV